MTDWIEELSIEKRNELRKEFSRIGHWQYDKGFEDGKRSERERIAHWARLVSMPNDNGILITDISTLLRIIEE